MEMRRQAEPLGGSRVAPDYILVCAVSANPGEIGMLPSVLKMMDERSRSGLHIIFMIEERGIPVKRSFGNPGTRNGVRHVSSVSLRPKVIETRSTRTTTHNASRL